ncbi:hypothetical protein BT69DRAFT_1282972 [Atractiella rhizophila]|nr:hypothetical protein BT69DRAFT_1282972 [Atractiella rhizophila]
MPRHANEVDSCHYSSVMRGELNCATSGFRSTGKRRESGSLLPFHLGGALLAIL